MFMIAKSLFMINLYAAYGGLTDIQKEGIYNIYHDYKTPLKDFCEFKIANPDKFLVCQIPGAHFVMHKELQKYNYCGKDNKCPEPGIYGKDAVYRPEWHEAGSVKIENPAELKSKLILQKEILNIYNYYKSAVYPNENNISWSKLLVAGSDKAGGAVYSKEPTAAGNSLRLMVSYDANGKSPWGVSSVDGGNSLGIRPTVSVFWDSFFLDSWLYMGTVSKVISIDKWIKYNADIEYFAAIVEERY